MSHKRAILRSILLLPGPTTVSGKSDNCQMTYLRPITPTWKSSSEILKGRLQKSIFITSLGHVKFLFRIPPANSMFLFSLRLWYLNIRHGRFCISWRLIKYRCFGARKKMPTFTSPQILVVVPLTIAPNEYVSGWKPWYSCRRLSRHLALSSWIICKVLHEE